ncbi:MAG TPA: YaaL family protein [Lentibacillus sp.]|uniref:YaaL family protein n=1 Tax=Lentibacillus sp. TaxID=1925746 RepID=UPI002B4B2D51|nr:YaaL family protein [Lentibacillus sp.]HLR61170.1 YaaL family protein [Lentibacillus sp.]
MGKKRRKWEVDEQLLDSLFTLEHEWKEIQSIVKKSIEPTDDGYYKECLAQAKYLFLWREARYRKISAIRYNP